MRLFNRRFARVRLATSQTLARVIARHEPPEPPGREAWLDGADSIEALWAGIKTPIWAVHLAHHLGVPPVPMMDIGTALLARVVRDSIEALPTVLDYGTIEPVARSVDTYFDWKEQPLEDLSDAHETYEAAALEQLTVIQAVSELGPESSPYRGSSGWPNELAPRLHRLVALQHWFAAARHASEDEPQRPPMRDELGLALAHAFATQPGSAEGMLEELVTALRA